MSHFTALYDANVLYPAPLRDLLMRLALQDLYRAKWTAAIHEEWMRNVLLNRPDLSREQLERTRQLMDANVRDCLVTGYECLIPALVLPDPDDAHVLAAAVHGGANIIVTFNLKDFPAAILAPHGIEAQHPDELITNLIGLNAPKVIQAVRGQRAGLRNPPRTADELLDILLQQQLPETVRLLRRFKESL